MGKEVMRYLCHLKPIWEARIKNLKHFAYTIINDIYNEEKVFFTISILLTNSFIKDSSKGDQSILATYTVCHVFLN